MGMEEIKNAIMEFAETSKKTKFYFKDMETGVKKAIPDVKAKDVKKAATALINEGILMFFSTGSTTLYGLKSRGISTEAGTLGEEEKE
jgi:hypothetical protein